MRRLHLRATAFGGALAAALSVAHPAIAQGSPPAAAAPKPATDDILVVGAKAKERRERAVAHVRASGIARGQQPAARWVVPVCAKVSGVAPETAAVVTERIRALARTVGAPLAQAPCTANAIVSFTDDAPAVVARVMARAPYQFKDVPMAARDALRLGEAPVRWWHIVKTGDADGVPPVTMQPAFVQIDGGVGGYGLPMGEGGVQQRYKEGAISTQSTRAITGASVVIDVKRAGPMQDLHALGDYAALVTLAEFRPATPPPPESILSLFAAEDPPEAATPSDIALLTQLYAIPLDREAKAHRRLLAKALIDAQRPRKR